jgi:hypothetical protein
MPATRSPPSTRVARPTPPPAVAHCSTMKVWVKRPYGFFLVTPTETDAPKVASFRAWITAQAEEWGRWSWFSRLAAALRGLLPGRPQPDPGTWILLGDGRGVLVTPTETDAPKVASFRAWITAQAEEWGR